MNRINEIRADNTEALRLWTESSAEYRKSPIGINLALMLESVRYLFSALDAANARIKELEGLLAEAKDKISHAAPVTWVRGEYIESAKAWEEDVMDWLSRAGDTRDGTWDIF